MSPRDAGHARLSPPTIAHIAGLRTIVTRSAAVHQTMIILLHGYAMRPEDLAPFGRSLGVPALYLFPQGTEAGSPGGYAWWSTDTPIQAPAGPIGPRDLASEIPAGLSAARQQLERFVTACQQRFQPLRLIVGGFSQGGMLACDWTLLHPATAHALLMLSASRVNMTVWQTHSAALAGLPILISHGQHDADIAFSAGERLRDFADHAGGWVTWAPFEGGHEIPLAVWRSVQRFLRPLVV